MAVWSFEASDDAHRPQKACTSVEEQARGFEQGQRLSHIRRGIIVDDARWSGQHDMAVDEIMPHHPVGPFPYVLYCQRRTKVDMNPDFFLVATFYSAQPGEPHCALFARYEKQI